MTPDPNPSSPPEVELDLGVALKGVRTAEALTAVAAQLPDPASLAPGTRVVLRTKREGWLGRLFKPRPDERTKAIYGSALLIRGYVRIGGDEDDCLVFGYAG